MPKGKGKKPSGSNKKKNRSSAGTSSQHSYGSQYDNGNTPSLDQGMYHTYKLKTQSFRDRIQKLLPKSTKLKSVSDLNRACDVIFDNAVSCDDGSQSDGSERQTKSNDNDGKTMSFVIPHEIILDLDVSIKLRSAFGISYGANSDKGHAYMLSTLEYCRKKLKQARSILKIKRKHAHFGVSRIADLQQNDEQKSSSNRYEYLTGSYDDNEDMENDDITITEDMVKKGTYPTLSPPEEPEEYYSIEEDLIKGSDRFQAIAFMLSIEQHMKAVSIEYEEMKKARRFERENIHYFQYEAKHNKDEVQCYRSKFSDLQFLLKSTVVTNMAIESVQSMEAALMVDRPHLSDLYSIIAVIFLPNYVAKIESMMKEREHQNDYLVKKFVGKIVGIVFHDGGSNLLDDAVKTFVQQSKLDYKKVYHEAEVIRNVMKFETISAMEEHLNPEMVDQLTGVYETKPHTWMDGSYYIGEDRCIFNTQKILQRRFNQIIYGTKFRGLEPFGGDVWIEDEVPAKKIRGDLDQLLSSEILPELIAWCDYRISPIGCIRSLPYIKELLPLVHLMRTHVEKLFDENKNNRLLPVPISLTFGIHALLTSIFELQGCGDVKRLAKFTKASFNTLFEQIEDVSNSDFAKQAYTFGETVSSLASCKNFVRSAGPPASATSEQHAFWNPVVGGQLLLFAVYSINICVGSAKVSGVGQLHLTLHLYHALKESKLIGDDEGPFLKMLDGIFDKTRKIWMGSRPINGEFEKKFHVSVRRKQKILPGEISASYKRVVERDFSEDIDDHVDDYCEPGMEKADKPFYDFISKAEMTKIIMNEVEMDIKPVNLFKVALILHEFVVGLGDAMGWCDMIVKDHIYEREKGSKGKLFSYDIGIKYQTYIKCMEQFFKGLDSLSDQSKETDNTNPGLDHDKAARFMVHFFNNVPEESYRYFRDGIEDMIRESQESYRALEEIKLDDFIRAKDLKERGNASFKKGKLAEALVSYNCAVQHYGSKTGPPGHQRETLVNIMSNIALIHHKKKSFSDAEEYATRALKIDPYHNKCLLRRAKVCYEISMNTPDGDYEKLSRALMDLMKCEFVLEQNKKEQVELETKVVLAIRKFNFFNKFGLVECMQIIKRITLFLDQNMTGTKTLWEDFSSCNTQNLDVMGALFRGLSNRI